ncbi:MAG: TetR/AcrR family transcriptional regulator [Bergeyella sp.]
MSNQHQKDQTQELIKETAKKLFFVQGKFDATTQEIADEAGVNRTLINYYFRSRDNLIQIIFEEAKLIEERKSALIRRTDLSFKEKIENFVDKTLKTSLELPYLETYIVTRLNKKGNCGSIKNDLDREVMKEFYQSIEEEMQKGTIEKMEPVQFVLNLISLLIFPTAMRPLIRENINVSNEDFDRIISERKDIIMNILFKK